MSAAKDASKAEGLLADLLARPEDELAGEAYEIAARLGQYLAAERVAGPTIGPMQRAGVLGKYLTADQLKEHGDALVTARAEGRSQAIAEVRALVEGMVPDAHELYGEQVIERLLAALEPLP